MQKKNLIIFDICSSNYVNQKCWQNKKAHSKYFAVVTHFSELTTEGCKANFLSFLLEIWRQWLPIEYNVHSFLWSVPWINGWVNNREAGDLRCHCTHYDIIVMANDRRWLMRKCTQLIHKWSPHQRRILTPYHFVHTNQLYKKMNTILTISICYLLTITNKCWVFIYILLCKWHGSLLANQYHWWRYWFS